MRFRDREHAAQLLADQLAGAIHLPFVISGIPIGGLIVARMLARRFQVPLTVAHVRRLSVPSFPGAAFGALDERGSAVLDPAAVRALHLSLADLEHARTRAWRELHRVSALLRDVMSLRDMAPHRHIVLTDDGMQTGFTMLAAVRAARRMGATSITVAVPCASEESIQRLEREADLMVCLTDPAEFVSIGDFYERFDNAEQPHAHSPARAASDKPAHDGAAHTALTSR
jgi:putative phosphoribosyl transferase